MKSVNPYEASTSSVYAEPWDEGYAACLEDLAERLEHLYVRTTDEAMADHVTEISRWLVSQLSGKDEAPMHGALWLGPTEADEPEEEEEERRDDEWKSECPEHGPQEVTSSYASGGSDPYNIEVLACRHHVMDMGDGPFIVKE